VSKESSFIFFREARFQDWRGVLSIDLSVGGPKIRRLMRFEPQYSSPKKESLPAYKIDFSLLSINSKRLDSITEGALKTLREGGLSLRVLLISVQIIPYSNVSRIL